MVKDIGTEFFQGCIVFTFETTELHDEDVNPCLPDNIFRRAPEKYPAEYTFSPRSHDNKRDIFIVCSPDDGCSGIPSCTVYKDGCYRYSGCLFEIPALLIQDLLCLFFWRDGDVAKY